MAEPDQIPSDLTLEITENLSPDKFMAATRAFFGCVEEVSRTVAGDGETPTWIVRTRDGSHLIGVDPGPGVRSAVVRAVYARVRRGVQQLAAGDVETTGLPDAAVRHLKALAELTERPKRRPVGVRIWVEKVPATIGRDIAKAIAENWKVDYRDFGTIEGRLEAIQERESLQIRVRDRLLRQTVSCYVPEEKLPQAFANFRKRVEISGIIHYRKDGTPISIDVEAIEPMPDDSELPSIDDVRGILRQPA